MTGKNNKATMAKQVRFLANIFSDYDANNPLNSNVMLSAGAANIDKMAGLAMAYNEFICGDIAPQETRGRRNPLKSKQGLALLSAWKRLNAVVLPRLYHELHSYADNISSETLEKILRAFSFFHLVQEILGIADIELEQYSHDRNFQRARYRSAAWRSDDFKRELSAICDDMVMQEFINLIRANLAQCIFAL